MDITCRQREYDEVSQKLRESEAGERACGRSKWRASRRTGASAVGLPGAARRPLPEAARGGGDARAAGAYYSRVARRPLRQRLTDDGSTLVVELVGDEMPTPAERRQFVYARPPARKLAKAIREKRRIIIDSPSIKRVVVLAPDGTVVLRWAIAALTDVALAQVHDLAKYDLGDGGDVKRQAACAGRADVQRLTSALRLEAVRRGYGLRGGAEVVAVEAGRCVYRHADGGVKTFRLSGSHLKRRDHCGLEILETLGLRELSDEIDELSRVELSEMRVDLPASSRIYGELFSLLTDDGASVLHCHKDINDLIPNALVKVNPRGHPVKGGELFVHDGVFLVDYGDRDVVFFRGHDYFHSVMRLGAPTGEDHSRVSRYSLIFARHKPSHKKANYVDVAADAPAEEDAARARIEREIEIAQAARPGPVTRKRRRTVN